MTTTSTLTVPGATLYYEVRGSGPVLLLICGGIYDAAGYAGLARELEDRYTVVTYDRRGNSRSPLTTKAEPQSVEVHGDDAHRVLAAVTDRPAYVFGNSSGAEIGLELAARHPEQVHTLVAHEPPLASLLPDRDRWFALVRTVEDSFHAEGAGAAMAAFSAGMEMGGGEPPQGEPDPETLAMMGRMGQNMEFFIGYEVPTFAVHELDVDAVRASSARIVPAAGEESTGEMPHRAALALADVLGTTARMFPGDHGGFGRHEPFAARLHEVLTKG